MCVDLDSNFSFMHVILNMTNNIWQEKHKSKRRKSNLGAREERGARWERETREQEKKNEHESAKKGEHEGLDEVEGNVNVKKARKNDIL